MPLSICRSHELWNADMLILGSVIWAL